MGILNDFNKRKGFRWEEEEEPNIPKENDVVRSYDYGVEYRVIGILDDEIILEDPNGSYHHHDKEFFDQYFEWA